MTTHAEKVLVASGFSAAAKLLIDTQWPYHLAPAHQKRLSREKAFCLDCRTGIAIWILKGCANPWRVRATFCNRCKELRILALSGWTTCPCGCNAVCRATSRAFKRPLS